MMTTQPAKIYQDQDQEVQPEAVKGVVTTSTTTTIPASALMVEQPKLGKKCCGCCCDFRRAVIICNIILLVIAVIAFILVLSGLTVDTDDISTEESDAYDTYFLVEIITLVITIAMNILSIIGAIKYNVGMVLAPAIYYVIDYVVGVANIFVFCSQWESEREDEGYMYAECSVPPGPVITGFAILLCWIYPHIGFVMEVKSGTMSAETYPREEYSCCCV